MTVNRNRVMLITGTSRGIGRYLAEYYVGKGDQIIGCSRRPAEYESKDYQHFCLDVSDEAAVVQMVAEIGRTYGRLDVLINNAGVASMNHALLTPVKTVHNILNTNVVGTFLFCREAARVMQKNHYGRIVNFATGATRLKLEGEAIYASSKAAVITLTEILARELAELGITVNAVAPPAIETDLTRAVPRQKIDSFLSRHAIKHHGQFSDVANVTDFFIKPESSFVTGQVIFLGGV